MQRNLLILGCVLGMLAVILGAFGAHGLKEVLSEESLTSYETGVRYQFYHAFLALIVANSSFFTSKTKNIVFYLILVGVILFSVNRNYTQLCKEPGCKFPFEDRRFC